MAKGKGTKLIAQNKKAYHDYFIEETIQAGISLAGTEVKSLRMGKCSLKESYIQIKDGEAFIYNMHIRPYEQGNIFNKDPLRPRRLLLHKAQIRKWDHEVRAAGYTVVPLKVYFDRSYVKVDIALAKGKKLYDKRDTIAKNDMRRQAEKDFKIRNLTLKVCRLQPFHRKGVKFHDLRGCNGFDGSLESRNSHPRTSEPRHQAGTFFKKKRQK